MLDDETGEMLEYRHVVQRLKYKKTVATPMEIQLSDLHREYQVRTLTLTLYSSRTKEKNSDERWKDVAYSRLVSNIQPQHPQQEEMNRTRLVFSSHNLKADMNGGTPTANLLTVKLLFNSIMSTPGVKFLGLDLKYFYLNTPTKTRVPENEFGKLPRKFH